MQLAHFTIDVDQDGIALLTWDMKDRSMNVIDATVMDDLEAISDRLSGDDAIKGAVITSGKDSFSGGADLAMLEGLLKRFHAARDADPDGAMRRMFEESRRLSVIYRKLETCGKPVVCAINGTCMGGAFELALACHGRIAAAGETVRMGLPEVKVGLFPGAGGTQRVARMMPAGDALQFLLKGQAVDPDRALAMKLVDKVVPPKKLIAAAKDWIRTEGRAVQPWDRDDFRLPGGPVWSKAGMMTFPPANALYRRETYDNYPGARAVLTCVFEGLQVPIDTGLTIESRHFAHVLQTKEAAHMIRSLFLSLQELNKGARRPRDVKPSRIRKVGVLGAGFMGAGIAHVTALAGIDVVLIDREQALADAGKAHAQGLMDKEVQRGRMERKQADAVLARILAATDYAALKRCDLVIEAVFEDSEVKKGVTQKAEAVIPASCTFGSNTSTMPITSLARNSKRPRNFIGIHFFSPVDKMMLVEIIMGKRTGDKALAKALDYVRAIRKTPIVVNDTRGFYVNRCVLRYMQEAFRMLIDGVPPAMIENAAKMAGMPVGPLALTDETAIDLAQKIMKQTIRDLGEKAVDPDQMTLIDTMVDMHGRHGRKNGKGFYDYPEKPAKKHLWPGLKELYRQQDPDDVDVEELKQRFLVTIALEASRVMEEGIVTDPREADVGSILAFGFAPYTGGTLSYIDGMGTAAFVELCNRLARRHGPRFRPNKLLKEMAAKGETFYGRFAPDKPDEKAAA